MTRSRLLALALVGGLLLSAPTPGAQQPAPTGEPALKPTTHPRLPADLSQFWLAPAKTALASPGPEPTSSTPMPAPMAAAFMRCGSAWLVSPWNVSA